MRLSGKVALISGGARGMGSVEAKLFASEGATVAIADVREEEGRQIEAEIAQTGGKALFIRLDVTKEEDWIHAVKYTVESFGRLDTLVNNAGISGRGDVEHLALNEWETIMAVNSTGVFLGAKTAIPEMRKSGGGSIINISSQLGIVGGDVCNPAYQASKGAVRILSKNIAIQYARYNIRCNSVHPGPIETPMGADRHGDNLFMESLISKVPMARMGQSIEVAYGVLYLASDESSYVTGTELVIDGGWVAQ